MRNALLLALALLLAGPALAAPPDGGADSSREIDEIVERRREMKLEYERMKEERAKALRSAAAEAAGGTDAIRGWRDESTGRLGAIDPEIADPIAASPETAPDAPPPPGSASRAFPVLIVGGGILLALLLRIFMPWIFDFRLRGLFRGNPGPTPRGKGAQTVKLRPRNERLGGRKM